MTQPKQGRASAGKAAAEPATTSPAARSQWARPSSSRNAPAATPVPVFDEPPRQVRIAVWLMYAGAALAGVNLVAALLTSGGERSVLRAAHPTWSSAMLTQEVREYLLFVGVTWALAIGIWLIMARTNLAGRGWARMAASVLCALDTLTLVRFLTVPSSLLSKLLVIPMWLVGAVAIVALWQRASSAYIRSRKASG